MSAGAHIDHANKKVALTIAVVAVLLAFAETLGKGAQTEALNRNIEAANLWSFFQAKTIRMTVARTAADTAEVQLPMLSGAPRDALVKRIDDWRRTAERYDTEPREGRKDLAARASAAEAKRDRNLAAYHQYETASAALQIAIVLASANVITGAAFLLWGAFGLAAVGLIFGCIGFFAPTAVHLF